MSVVHLDNAEPDTVIIMGESDPPALFSLERADFKTCLRQSPFRFLVGSEKEAFNIHPGILRKISEPLYKLMTNGSLEQSVTGVAGLPESDPETFVNFCEYAYSGGYLVHGTVSQKELTKPRQIIDLPLKAYHCWWCGSDAGYESTHELFPFCTSKCLKDAKKGKSPNTRRCIICGTNDFSARATGRYSSQVPIVCSGCSGHDHSMTLDMLNTHSKTFPNMRINVGFMTHAQVEQNLLIASPTDRPVDNLVAHAKLWVFADMYLVPSLKELCLHKLHRDLMAFTPTAENATKITQLAVYVYEHVRMAHDPVPRELNPRSLVLAYVTKNSESLLQFDDSKQLINGGGELVVEIIQEMAKFNLWAS